MDIKKVTLSTLVLLLSSGLTQAAPTWGVLEPDWTGTAEVQQSNPVKPKDKVPAKEELNGEEWFARAYSFHQSDRYAEAIESFKHALDLGYRKPTAMYNIACGYSLLNDKENALLWLQRSIDAGFDGAELLADDSDLDPLRSDDRFRKLIASVPYADQIEKYSNKRRDRVEQADFEFERLQRNASKDGNEWASVGVQLLLLRELNRSIVALHRAVGHLEYRGGTAKYNLACAYALVGDREAGIEWLTQAVNSGFDNPDKVRNDPDLNSLRSDPRFARIEKASEVLSLSQFYGDFSDNGRYPKSQWLPAVDLYQSLVKTEPNNGRAWFNLGFSLHYTAQHGKAIEAFTRARELGYNAPVSAYNIACAYAMLKQRDESFEWLKKSVDEGYNPGGNLSGDRDLDNLRSDPRFQQFVVRQVRSKK